MADHFMRPALVALMMVAAPLALSGTAEADAAEVPDWTVESCSANGTLSDGTAVTVRLDPCRPGAFEMTKDRTMKWGFKQGGTGHEVFEPNIPLDAKIPALDVTNATGRVSIDFSRPVSDPVLHIGELGGGRGHLRFSQRWKLADATGKLEKVSGNNQLAVQAGSFGAADVAGINDFQDCSDQNRDGKMPGCGSVRVNGSITGLAFDVSIDRAYEAGDPPSKESTTFTLSVPGKAAAVLPPCGGTKFICHPIK